MKNYSHIPLNLVVFRLKDLLIDPCKPEDMNLLAFEKENL